MKKVAYLIVAFLAGAINVNQANAGCNNPDDPCAPKRKKGEWVSSLALGVNGANGNSKNSNVSALGELYKETDDNIIDFGLNYGFSQDRKKTEDQTSKNDLTVNGGVKHLLSDRAFIGFGAKYFRDTVADIDYRINLNPSFGYFLLKDEDFKFSLDAGPGYTFEKTGGIKDDFFSPRIGEEFSWIISCTAKLFQKAEYIFDASESDNYLINASAGVESALSSQLSLVLGIKDTYDNLPAAGKLKNDTSIFSALKLSF